MSFSTNILVAVFNLLMLVLVFGGIYYGAKYAYDYYENTYLPNSTGATKPYTSGGKCWFVPQTVTTWIAQDSVGYALTTRTNPGGLEFFLNESDCLSWLNDTSITKVSVLNTPGVGNAHYHGNVSDFH
jgi:hypothetical protein